jgi:glycosyltransferase involved in cell wall biosynthesis
MNSICIATYNGEKYIHQQLTSILSQINIDDEVIISDDDSTDNTIEIIKSLNDKRIKIIHGGFHHFKWNFANALQHSKGEYIFLSDQDDIWIEGKYQACLNKLQKVDLICHNSSVVDENLNTIIPSFFDYYHSGAGIIKNSIKKLYTKYLLLTNA